MNIALYFPRPRKKKKVIPVTEDVSTMSLAPVVGKFKFKSKKKKGGDAYKWIVDKEPANAVIHGKNRHTTFKNVTTRRSSRND